MMKNEAKPLAIPDVTLGQMLFQSGFFPDVKSQAQAVVKVLAGRELGFGPVYSMTKIHIVQGKVAIAAEALGALVKRSGRYDYLVKTLTDTEALLEFTDNGKVIYSSHFTLEDAKRANLVKPDSNWQKWPRAMLMSKALSQGARIVCPHIISGVSTPEEFGIETDEEGDVKAVPESVPEPPAAMTANDLGKEARKRGYSTWKEVYEVLKVAGKDELALMGFEKALEALPFKPVPEPTTEPEKPAEEVPNG